MSTIKTNWPFTGVRFKKFFTLKTPKNFDWSGVYRCRCRCRCSS